MKKVAVYGNAAEFPLPRGYEAVSVSNTDFSDDTACLIVSCEAAGDELAKVIFVAKAKNIPVIAAANADCAEQERLFALGADDVLQLPVCEKLLARRIEELICYCRESLELLPDFLDLRDISIENGESGSFKVQEHDFMNLYRFVLRLLERLNESAQMLVFTLNCDFDDNTEQQLYEQLSAAVHNCLRRGDISSKCGSGKILVLLVGANDDGGHLVANRIMSNFYGGCDDDSCSLSYNIREIKPSRLDP